MRRAGDRFRASLRREGLARPARDQPNLAVRFRHGVGRRGAVRNQPVGRAMTLALILWLELNVIVGIRLGRFIAAGDTEATR
jgi:hypothetical protein